MVLERPVWLWEEGASGLPGVGAPGPCLPWIWGDTCGDLGMPTKTVTKKDLAEATLGSGVG